MATVGAATSGNWSSPLVFPMAPQAGDIVVANGNTVTIDQDITVGTIQTLAAGIYLSGGQFNVSTDRTINAHALSGTTQCLVASGSANVTHNGNSTGGTTAADYGTVWGSSGTLTRVGTITGGSHASAYGLRVTAGTVQHAGSIVAATASGISMAGGTLNWTSGLGTPSSSAPAIGLDSGAVLNVTPDWTTNPSTASPIVEVGASSSVVCQGDVAAEAGRYPLITLISSTATATFEGSVTAVDGIAPVRGSAGGIAVTINGNIVCSADGTFPFVCTASTSAAFRFLVHASDALTHSYVPTGGGTRTLSTAGVAAAAAFGGMVSRRV